MVSNVPSNGVPIEQTKIENNNGQGDQGQQTQNVKQEKTISVFSNYDGDKSGTVNSQEANSLFTRWNHNTSMADGVDTTQGNIGSKIRNLAVSKFNPVEQFNKLMNSFSVNTGSKKFTVNENGSYDKAGADNYAKKLDAQVTSEAAKMSESVNKKIEKAYQEALEQAKVELMQDENAADGLKEVNADSLKGIKGEAKEFKGAENTKENIEKTIAYASKDGNKNERVSVGEAGVSVNPNIESSMVAEGFDASNAQAKAQIKQMANFDVAQEFANELGSNDFKYSAKKFDGAATDAEIKNAIDDIDAKVQAKIDKAVSKANEKVAEKYQDALNKAFDDYKKNPEQPEEVKTSAGDTPVVKKEGGEGDKKVEDRKVKDVKVEDKKVEDKKVEDKKVEDKPVEDNPEVATTTNYSVKSGDNRGLYGIVQGSYSRSDGKPMTHQNIMAVVRNIQDSNNIDRSVGIKSNMNLPNEFDLGGGVKATLGESIKTDAVETTVVEDQAGDEVVIEEQEVQPTRTPPTRQEVESTAQTLYNYVDNNSFDTGVQYMHDAIVNNDSVNADNIVEIMEEYERQSGGESIVESMTSEWLSTGDSSEKPSGRKLAFDTTINLVAKLLQRAENSGVDSENGSYKQAMGFVKSHSIGGFSEQDYMKKLTTKWGASGKQEATLTYDADLDKATKKIIKGLLAAIKEAESTAQA